MAKYEANMYVFMGGTFDPIHQGHLQGALDVSEQLASCVVHLLPTKVPVHKQRPQTLIEQRIAMIEMAIKDYPKLQLDRREVDAQEASFTINTLLRLREELGEKEPIVMIIGMDSFITLPAWHRASEFLSLCHVVVLQRPNYQYVETTELQPYLAARNQDKKKLLSKNAGQVFFLEQPLVDISATQIRHNTGAAIASSLLPDIVNNYIEKHKLYNKPHK
jgi:nicotinate-nucleotide adenylyltransferase